MGPSGPALLALLLLMITAGARAGECRGLQPAHPAGAQHPGCPRTQPEGHKASGRRGDSDLLGQLRPGSDGGQSRPEPGGQGLLGGSPASGWGEAWGQATEGLGIWFSRTCFLLKEKGTVCAEVLPIRPQGPSEDGKNPQLSFSISYRRRSAGKCQPELFK